MSPFLQIMFTSPSIDSLHRDRSTFALIPLERSIKNLKTITIEVNKARIKNQNLDKMIGEKSEYG